MPEVPVSNYYRHAVSELYTALLEKRITEQEFSQRLDQATEEEAKKQEHLGPTLVRQALGDVEKDISESQKQAFRDKIQQETLKQMQQKQQDLNEQNERKRKETAERKEQEHKEREARQALEAEQKRQERERKQFREVTTGNIRERETSVRNLQRQYNTLQIILLIFSAITATMAGIDGIARGWVAVTGVIATIAGGMLTTFKIQDRIYANHKAAAELRLECQKYDYHIEDYKGASDEDAFIKFSRAVNGIQGEQMLQEVELWNPKPKRNEDKKTLTEKQADKPEEDTVEKASVAEGPEAEELVTEQHEEARASLEKQQEGSASPVAPTSL